MKHIILIATANIVFFAACNGSNNQPKTGNDTVQSAQVTTSEKPVATADQQSTSSVKEIVNSYLKMKNALAGDDDKGTAAAGDAMVAAFDKFDKSSLTADQKKVYEDVESDAREHAEHIGKNAGNIKHQREHFDMLSKDMYELVKTFGAGQQLYYDHCPMYNNGKGADWISETKEISNPYFGKKMSGCGTVKEELK
ncbi:DUF3347 domain-containing protein [Chitinophaga filiformis]|uniref:DUF3347 domain-containing protein n=1 Tax=Chitinophaga filiformis TaxID=104663 RepID=A0A1G8ACI5_CHIFI|nr:DUF3347 domain-containing protein [Chitinophaga filiformis]SDH18674.1 Protein of unknown function [Chitinophaga filiformis]